MDLAGAYSAMYFLPNIASSPLIPTTIGLNFKISPE